MKREPTLKQPHLNGKVCSCKVPVPKPGDSVEYDICHRCERIILRDNNT